MKAVGIIPARMGSSRFPGKPLAPLLGRPMIEHVYKRTAMASALDEVVVATCDTEIRDAVEGFGGRAVMTADTHERASDRVAEAAAASDADVVVLVQGDEPMTAPEMIDQALAPFADGSGVSCINLTKRIISEEEFRDPNTIKVVMDRSGNALFMSREPIPTLVNNRFADIAAYKQVCIIPFTRAALAEFSALEPTPLEVTESIDMMRFLEHGRPVRMVETDVDTHAVDTPADLDLVAEMMRDDALAGSY